MLTKIQFISDCWQRKSLCKQRGNFQQKDRSLSRWSTCKPQIFWIFPYIGEFILKYCLTSWIHCTTYNSWGVTDIIEQVSAPRSNSRSLHRNYAIQAHRRFALLHECQTNSLVNPIQPGSRTIKNFRQV